MRRRLERGVVLCAALVLLVQIASTLAGFGTARSFVSEIARSPNIAAAAQPAAAQSAADHAKPGAAGAPEVSDNASHVASVTLSFPSFAALKAFNVTSISERVVTATTAGYHAPGDGGASTYDWDATSTRKRDNIFFVKPNDVAAGRWALRLPGGALHPEQAGARCNGVADDAAALNALSAGINNASETVSNGVRIELNPNRFCLIASATWRTPNGMTERATWKT